MIWKPNTTIATIIEQDEKFLMVEEMDHGAIVINQPAGHLEEHEGLVDAAIRETLEETGWHVRPTHLTGIYQWRSPVNDITYMRFCFSAQAIRHDETRVLDPDILRTVWLSRAEIPGDKASLRSPMVLRCIDDYLAGTRYPLALLSNLNAHAPRHSQTR